MLAPRLAWCDADKPLMGTQAVEQAFCNQGGPLPALALGSCDATHAPSVRQRQLLFTFYVHSSLLSFSEFLPGDLFHGTLIRNLSHAQRGDTTAAVRQLLRAALAEQRNERFVLLSDTDIPLYPAKLVWMQLATVRPLCSWRGILRGLHCAPCSWSLLTGSVILC